MRGDRPEQSHMAVIWDTSQQVGRTDVTDVIERAIDSLDMAARLYPDLYAHRITEALINAGLIEKEVSCDAATTATPHEAPPRTT